MFVSAVTPVRAGLVGRTGKRRALSLVLFSQELLALLNAGLGIVEGLTKVFWPEASSTVVFFIMVIVLLIRPAGLFGKEK